MAETANLMQLGPETLQAFERYGRDAEKEMDGTLHQARSFLWCDAEPGRAERVRAGSIPAEFWLGHGPLKVRGGLVHDWVGAAFIPDRTVRDAITLVQDYANHKVIYQPEVIDSKILQHHGNDFRIYLRLLKKKVITVVLDTDHEVEYLPLSGTRWFCRSHTTCIAEVENPGSPQEAVLPPDSGHGFLWRLYSYWKFQEKKGDLYVECRAISLTREVPFGLGWLIEPIIQNLPRESLIHTLECTRRGLQR
jgi:hypothetical protein